VDLYEIVHVQLLLLGLIAAEGSSRQPDKEMYASERSQLFERDGLTASPGRSCPAR